MDRPKTIWISLRNRPRYHRRPAPARGDDDDDRDDARHRPLDGFEDGLQRPFQGIEEPAAWARCLRATASARASSPEWPGEPGHPAVRAARKRIWWKYGKNINVRHGQFSRLVGGRGRGAARGLRQQLGNGASSASASGSPRHRSRRRGRCSRCGACARARRCG